jgi:hypothetical protein
MAKKRKQWQKGTYNVIAQGREPWREKKNLKEQCQRGENDGRRE